VVYGLNTASTFGVHFPDADMPGYWDHFKKLFEERKAKGLITNDSFVQFKSEFRKEFDSGTNVVDETLMPTNFLLAKPYKRLGDMIWLGMGVAVTDRLRAIIEHLEPGRHQFKGVEVALPSADPHPNKYFIMRVLSRLDAFDRTRSDPTCRKSTDRILQIVAPKGAHAYGIALSRRVMADHHIWRGFVSAETGISGFDFYFSDILKAAIDAAGLKMPRFYRMAEV